jgi:hypothetical protein
MYLICNEETSKAGAAGRTVSINFRIENIFNGLFESWNVGENWQNFAEIQQNNTCESAVNPTGINHSRVRQDKLAKDRRWKSFTGEGLASRPGPE